MFFCNIDKTWLLKLARFLGVVQVDKSWISILEALAKYHIHPPLTDAEMMDLLALAFNTKCETEERCD